MILVTFPSIGWACSCLVPPPPQEALERSEAVFTGKVMTVTKPEAPVGSSAAPVRVLFEVTETWKGTDQSQAIVRTAMDSASCGFHFEEGKEYLVYAQKGPMGHWETNICTRTVELAHAQEDLAALGEGSAPAHVVDLEGELKGASWYLWGGIAILIGIALLFGWKRARK